VVVSQIVTVATTSIILLLPSLVSAIFQSARKSLGTVESSSHALIFAALFSATSWTSFAVFDIYFSFSLLIITN
jgi:hypothetical protein